MQFSIEGVLREISKDKKIPEELVKDILKDVLLEAYKKEYGHTDNAVVEEDKETGKMFLYSRKTVVDKVKDRSREISLAEARKIVGKNAVVGEEIKVPENPRNYSRRAIQVASQVLIQKFREAQKDVVYATFKSKERQIITGKVRNISRLNRNSQGKAIFVYFERQETEGVLPPEEQIPGDSNRYRIGDPIKALLLKVEKKASKTEIILSRSHPDFVKRLLEVAIPEIANGDVVVKKVARIPGERAKAAVYSKKEGIDPVGACIGGKGVRIQPVVRELADEKLEIVQWSDDPKEFVKNALGKDRIVKVLEMEDEKSKFMLAVVVDDKFPLAMGRYRQNVKLAEKLTGYRIELIRESEYRATEEAQKELGPIVSPDEVVFEEDYPLTYLELPESVEQELKRVGIDTLGKLYIARDRVDKILERTNLDEETLKEVFSKLDEVLEVEEEED